MKSDFDERRHGTLIEVKMRILIILCILTLAFGFPTLSDKNNNIEIVSSSERRFSDLYQFQ